MDKAVDNRDDAGGIREHLTPLGKWAIGGHDGGLELITAVDNVKQQIGMAIAVRQIPHLVDNLEDRASCRAA